MNLRKISFIGLMLSLVLLSSCGATRRFGKDVSMGALTPVLTVYGGATDAYAGSYDVAEGLGGGSLTQFFAFPPLFIVHGVKHFLYGIVHVVDAVFYPFYGAVELNPDGPEVEPLQIYTGTWFDKPAKKSGTDVQSGAGAESGSGR